MFAEAFPSRPIFPSPLSLRFSLFLLFLRIGGCLLVGERVAFFRLAFLHRYDLGRPEAVRISLVIPSVVKVRSFSP